MTHTHFRSLYVIVFFPWVFPSYKDFVKCYFFGVRQLTVVKTNLARLHINLSEIRLKWRLPPAGGALCLPVPVFCRCSENPPEWDLCVFSSSPAVPTPFLTFPANFIHAAPPLPLIFHTYPTCGTHGEKGQRKRHVAPLFICTHLFFCVFFFEESGFDPLD